MTRYSISADGRSITCHRCGSTSANMHDVKHRYCGECHHFLDDAPAGPRTTVMAALHIDGEVRPTCIGCSKVLYFCGALQKVGEWPINERTPEFVITVWKLADGYTLDDCRKLIGSRHLDTKPWGAP